MKRLLVAGLLVASGVMPLCAATGTPVRSGCHASLNVADAKLLAAATPNARAFVSNFDAKLATHLVRENADGSVAVRVVADEPKRGREEIGVYTVSLRTGRVTDDDMEPADDGQTAALRAKLIARHCGAK